MSKRSSNRVRGTGPNLGRSALWKSQSAEIKRLFPDGILDMDVMYPVKSKGRCEICGRIGDIEKIRRLFKVKGRNEVRICAKDMPSPKEFLKRYFPDMKVFRVYYDYESACRGTKGVDLVAWNRVFRKQAYFIDELDRRDKAMRRCERAHLRALKDAGATEEYAQIRKEVRLERKIRAADAKAFRVFQEDGCITYEFRDEGAFKEIIALNDELVRITKDPEGRRIYRGEMRCKKRIRKGLLKEKEERERTVTTG